MQLSCQSSIALFLVSFVKSHPSKDNPFKKIQNGLKKIEFMKKNKETKTQTSPDSKATKN